MLTAAQFRCYLDSLVLHGKAVTKTVYRPSKGSLSLDEAFGYAARDDSSGLEPVRVRKAAPKSLLVPLLLREITPPLDTGRRKSRGVARLSRS